MISFVFFATCFIYNWQRFAKIKSNHAISGNRLVWMQNNPKTVYLFLILTALGSTTLLLFLKTDVLKILVPFGAVSFLYVGKFPFKNLFNLRDVPFLKAHLVAGVWAGMVTILPAFQSDLILSKEIRIFFAVIYCFILSLAIIFDIRDVELDEPEKLTVPQLIGKRAAVVSAIILNLISCALLIYLKDSLMVLLLSLFCLAAVLFILALKKKDDFYFSFWLDGLILLFSTMIFFI